MPSTPIAAFATVCLCRLAMIDKTLFYVTLKNDRFPSTTTSGVGFKKEKAPSQL